MAGGAEDGPTIDICPRCLSPLHGSPRRHACTECGLRYDEHSRLWRGSRAGAILWRARRDFFPLAALIVIAALAGFRFWLTCLVALGVTAVGMHLVYLALRFEYVGSLVACTPEGLYVRDALFKPQEDDTAHHEELIPWSAVESATPHTELRRACLTIGSEPSEILGPFRTRQEAVDFVASVRFHIGAGAAAPADDSEPDAGQDG